VATTAVVVAGGGLGPGQSAQLVEEEPGNSGRFTEVVLRPAVTVADPAMLERAEALHEEAHDTCFIAKPVNFPVRHEAVTTSS
jgi:organic hydroperoxide reductase OsmC/OhrA